MRPLKFCKRCATEKPLSEFHRNRARPDGLQSYCKPCQIKLAQATRDPALHYQCARAYRQRNPVKARGYARDSMRRFHDRTRKRPYVALLHLRIDAPEDT